MITWYWYSGESIYRPNISINIEHFRHLRSGDVSHLQVLWLE